MFNPIANGISPRTVVIAVNNTGRNRALPPATIALKISSRGSKSSFSIASSSRLLSNKAGYNRAKQHYYLLQFLQEK